VTRLRRLNITVNRARRNSDAGAGAGAETSIKMARDREGGGRIEVRGDTGPCRKEGCEGRQGGVDQLEETGDFRATERAKLSRGAALSLHIVLTLSN